MIAVYSQSTLPLITFEGFSERSGSAAPGAIDATNPSRIPIQPTSEPPSPLVPPSIPAPSHPPISESNQTPSQAPSPSLITLKRVFPDNGPLCGHERILAIGSGFREEQKLLIRFGDKHTSTKTTFSDPTHLECLLPPHHTAGPVTVTLHSPDEPGLVLQDVNVLFT